MALELKLRYMRMLYKWGPMTRALSTKRALGQIREFSMVEYNALLNKLSRSRLIKIKKCTEERRGQVPDIISITTKGEEWVKSKDKKK